MLLVAALAACGPKEWTSHEECAGVGDAEEREACWVATLPKLFCTDPAQGEQLVEEKIATQLNQDYVWMLVGENVAPETPKYCERIVNAEFRTRCLNVTKRPHLHSYTTEFCPNKQRKHDPNATPGRGPNRGGTAPPPPGAPPPSGALPGAGAP
ncbi:MAG: hypothetical protein ACOZNI_16595 [Myxococcota bacterium]